MNTASVHRSLRHLSSTFGPWLPALLLGAQLFVADLSFEAVHLGQPGQRDLSRLAIQVPMLLLPLGLLALRSAGFERQLLRGPQLMAMLWLAWGAVTILWGLNSAEGAFSALGITGLWVTGAWYVHRYGFDAFSRAFCNGATVFILGSFVADAIGFVGRPDGRFTGLAVQTNHLSRLALVTFVLVLVDLTRGRRRTDVVSWISLALSAAAMVATTGRTSFVAVAVAVVLLAGVQFGWARTGVVVAVVVASGVAVLQLLPSPEQLVSRTGSPNDVQTANGRDDIWRASLGFIEERPLAGAGMAGGHVLLPLAAQEGLVHSVFDHSHNLFLEVAVGEGLIGVALLLGALAAYALTPPRPGDRTTWILLVTILVSSLTEALHDRPTATYLLFGALFAQRTPDTLSARRRWRRPHRSQPRHAIPAIAFTERSSRA